MQTAVLVVARSANWVSSGVTVRKGDVIDIWATGKISFFAAGALNVGPAGTGPSDDTRNFVANKLSQYALLGLVSPVAPPRSPTDWIDFGRDQTLPMFVVGESLRYTADRDGTLYLIVNDSNFGDNRGRFQVTVSPAKSLRCDAIEVVQSVQDRKRSIPLLRGKPTLVRVYLSPSDATVLKDVTTGTLTGQIDVTAGGAVRHVDATGSLAVSSLPPGDQLDLPDGPRGDLARSLNFVLPDDLLAGASLTVSAVRCTLSDPAHTVTVTVTGASPITVTVEAAPSLRLRVIGLRYFTDQGSAKPRTVDYALIKSWLLRAFPVKAVEMSGFVTSSMGISSPFTTVDAPGVTIDKALAQVAAIRALDMHYSQVDRRTLYYGLLYDERTWTNDVNPTFMRGKAMAIPASSDPTTVAAGPTGPPMGTDNTKPGAPARGYKNDKDSSYGDFYAAHEIGHLLGRQHVRSTDETDVDSAYPVKESDNGGVYKGRIGDPANPWVGVDMGDTAQVIERRALPYTSTYDVMTYQDACWVSGYTYTGLLARLRADEASAGPTITKGSFLSVVIRQTGADTYSFDYVTPVGSAIAPITGTAIATDAPSGDKAEVRILITIAGKTRVVSYPVSRRLYFYGLDAALTLDRKTGETVTGLQYHQAKKMLTSWTVQDQQPTVVTNVTVTPSSGSTPSVTVRWQSNDGDPRFAVQVSSVSSPGTDAWTTVAVGLNLMSCIIEKDENWDATFTPWEKAKVRVMTTNGIDAVFSAPVPIVEPPKSSASS